MIKSQTKLLSLTLVLLLAAILIVSFGCGGDSSGVVPQTNVNQTGETENLVTKDVEGIIYNISSSSKSSEEEEQNFAVLPIPMEGDEGFLAQVNQYLAENPSSKASDSEMEELLTAFSEEAGNYQPLPSWNSSAGLYSSYADSETSAGVSVGADGSFNASVLTDADEDVVPMNIIIPDGEVFEVETISSDLLNSSETSEINLKGCPAKVITKPNRVIIFKVFSKPGANLYEAGLQFNLADSEVGAVCGPIFLRCFGVRKTNVAYGLIYVKKSVSTPFDTAIEVTTAGGQSLSIPMQVVKNTVQVTGTVYSDSPIVKGWVKSIGSKSFCRIGADGSYVLPKTYMGTGRKISAKWWTIENGQKVKHMETKYVDLMVDETVDFGVVVEPTPIVRHPMDSFYDEQVSKVLEQFDSWEAEFGREQAVQKTVNWINRKIEGPPVPEEIIEATIDKYDSTKFWLLFTDGLGWCIGGKVYGSINLDNNFTVSNRELSDENLPTDIISSKAGTVGSEKILVLAPFEWEDRGLEEALGIPNLKNYMVYGGLAEDLGNKGYTVVQKLTSDGELNGVLGKPNAQGIIEIKFYWDGVSDIVQPGDFENMNDYGIIYIASHANQDGIISNIVYEEPSPWIDNPLGTWLFFYRDREFKYHQTNNPAGGLWSYYTWETVSEPVIRYKTLLLSKNFFKEKSYNNSIVYVDGCNSWYLHEAFMASTSKPKVYLGYTSPAYIFWGRSVAYQFFYQMIYGFKEPIPIPRPGGSAITLPSPENPIPPPMSVKDSHNKLIDIGLNLDSYNYPDNTAYNQCENCALEIDTQGGQYDETYFPVPLNIIVQED